MQLLPYSRRIEPKFDDTTTPAETYKNIEYITTDASNEVSDKYSLLMSLFTINLSYIYVIWFKNELP